MTLFILIEITLPYSKNHVYYLQIKTKTCTFILFFYLFIQYSNTKSLFDINLYV